MPKHRNPDKAARTASAPYNFVPLPEAVVNAAESIEALPKQDMYHTDRHTGHFEVTLTTCSPLYIRAPLSINQYEKLESEASDTPFRDQVKNRPEFFHHGNPGRPVIPGSSLRGMLRTLLEIVSYGKMERVTDKSLFFRTMDNSALGDYYRGRMQDNVEAGFMQRQGDSYVIETCEMARVDKSKIGGSKIYQGQNANSTPRWNGDLHQWQRVWVKRSGSGNTVATVSPDEQSGFEEGRLVITGWMHRKKKEFIFLLPTSASETIKVPDEIVERFHDDDQITRWQEDAFPSSKPENDCREREGHIRSMPDSPGDPVFFLREHDGLTFFGRAGMFRLPYRNSPLDLVPEKLRDEMKIDFPDALFGFTRVRPGQNDSDNHSTAYAGRVSVTDANLLEEQEVMWLRRPEESALVPQVLSSPKPTCFQHYLVQDKKGKGELRHYDPDNNGDTTVIRGHKLYWHQGDRKADDIADPNAGDDSSQHTHMRPLKSGVSFSFRVYFENLSEQELGALCWMLQPHGDPEQRYVHSLGMGKPLGMGAVELDPTLHLSRREQRYQALFTGDAWATGQERVAENSMGHFTCSFEKYILSALKYADVSFAGEATRLRDLGRIGMLLKMMEWPGFPAEPEEGPFLSNEDRPNTRYMKLQEFKDRLVLPSPEAFGELTGSAGIDQSSSQAPQRDQSGKRTKSIEHKKSSQQKDEDPPTDRQVGTVKWFSNKKGYGFITPEEGYFHSGKGDIFVHHSKIEADGFRSLDEGERVEYTVHKTDKGYSALQVRRI